MQHSAIQDLPITITEASPDRPDGWLRREPFLFCLIALLFLVINFWGLTRLDFDQDELITSRVIRKPYTQLIQERLGRGHAPLYFVCVRAWRLILGFGPARIHSLNVMIGLMSLILIYSLCAELNLKRWGLFASLLWAVHPTVVFYARYARPYMGNMALTVAILLFTFRFLRRGRPGDFWVLAGLAPVCALWNHLLALIWLVLLAASLFPEQRQRAGIGRVRRIAALALGLHGVVIAMAYLASLHAPPLEWIKEPDSFRGAEVILEALGGPDAKANQLGTPWGLPLLSVAAMVFMIRACWFGRPAGGAEQQARLNWRLIVIGALLPLLMMVVITFTIQPILLPRYATVFFTGWGLAACALPMMVGSRAWRWLLAVGLIYFSLHGTWRVVQRTEGLADCIRGLQKVYRPGGGDLVVTFNRWGAEALFLFAGDDFNLLCFHQGLKKHDLQKFNPEAIRARRVWFLDFIYQPGLFSRKSSLHLVATEFYRYTGRHAALLGYSLNGAKNSALPTVKRK